MTESLIVDTETGFEHLCVVSSVSHGGHTHLLGKHIFYQAFN